MLTSGRYYYSHNDVSLHASFGNRTPFHESETDPIESTRDRSLRTTESVGQEMPTTQSMVSVIFCGHHRRNNSAPKSQRCANFPKNPEREIYQLQRSNQHREYSSLKIASYSMRTCSLLIDLCNFSWVTFLFLLHLFRNSQSLHAPRRLYNFGLIIFLFLSHQSRTVSQSFTFSEGNCVTSA